MLLYGALCYDNSCNLGDNIQTIAAIQYLPRVDFWVDRDSGVTNLPMDGKGIVIYNGWFNLNYWRNIPSNVQIIFESFHLQVDHRNEKIYDCLKQYTITPNLGLIKAIRNSPYPVGCRDIATQGILSNFHIPCAYSGCLTLTLNKRNVIKHNDVTVIDVDCSTPWISELKNVRVRSQVTLSTDNKTKLTQAQEILDEIEGSRLIITSRLHSALPAIAFKVPVIFITGTLVDSRLCDYLKYMPISDGISCPVDIGHFTWDKMISDYNVTPLIEGAEILKDRLVKLISTQ